MRQDRVHREELELEAEKKLKFWGTTVVKLEKLSFGAIGAKELNRKNVDRLKSIFEEYGCRRLEVQHHIPAIICKQVVESSLLTKIRGPQTGEYPELKLPDGATILCLHGRHRIQAGKEFLSVREKWWTVDLYLADATSALRTFLVEEYSNEEKPTDGEIYRKIRHYHFNRNLSFEARWWARLSPHSKQNLKGLFRHRELTAAFDALLDVPGLWHGMMISTLHKMIAMRCDELVQEVLHYLEHIRSFWHDLVDDDPLVLASIDDTTVREMELRAPGASSYDAAAVQACIRTGTSFPGCPSDQAEEIIRRLLCSDGLIPSLSSFFKDLAYLQSCADCVKRLVKIPPRNTLFTAMEQVFEDRSGQTDQVLIERGDLTFAVVEGTLEDRVRLGYQQLHVHAMRNFLNMPKDFLGKDVLAISKMKADKSALRALAALASCLGFNSSEIQALLEYPQTDRVPDINRPRPNLVTSGPGEPMTRRKGVPVQKTHEEDRELFWLENFYACSPTRDEGITSLYVRRSVFIAFYGIHTANCEPEHWSRAELVTSDLQSGHRESNGTASKGEQCPDQNDESRTAQERKRREEESRLQEGQVWIEQERIRLRNESAQQNHMKLKLQQTKDELARKDASFEQKHARLQEELTRLEQKQLKLQQTKDELARKDASLDEKQQHLSLQEKIMLEKNREQSDKESYIDAKEVEYAKRLNELIKRERAIRKTDDQVRAQSTNEATKRRDQKALNATLEPVAKDSSRPATISTSQLRRPDGREAILPQNTQDQSVEQSSFAKSRKINKLKTAERASEEETRGKKREAETRSGERVDIRFQMHSSLLHDTNKLSGAESGWETYEEFQIRRNEKDQTSGFSVTPQNGFEKLKQMINKNDLMLLNDGGRSFGSMEAALEATFEEGGAAVLIAPRGSSISEQDSIILEELNSLRKVPRPLNKQNRTKRHIQRAVEEDPKQPRIINQAVQSSQEILRPPKAKNEVYEEFPQPSSKDSDLDLGII